MNENLPDLTVWPSFGQEVSLIHSFILTVSWRGCWRDMKPCAEATVSAPMFISKDELKTLVSM